jgi:hypothetical protein
MLCLCRLHLGFYCIVLTCISLNLFSTNPSVVSISTASAIEYFNSINEFTPIDEALDAIACLRQSLEQHELSPPNVSLLIEGTKKLLNKQGMFLNPGIFTAIENRLIQKELSSKNRLMFYNVSFQLAKKSSDRNRGTNDDFGEVSGQCIIGAVKVLAGALICIIPHPSAKVGGGALIGTGIADITEALVEKDKENVEREKKYGPPDPPPHFPRDFYDKKKMSCSITL